MGDNARKEHYLLFLFIYTTSAKRNQWKNYKQRLLSTR